MSTARGYVNLRRIHFVARLRFRYEMLILCVGVQNPDHEGSLTPSSAIAEPQLVIYVSRS